MCVCFSCLHQPRLLESYLSHFFKFQAFVLQMNCLLFTFGFSRDRGMTSGILWNHGKRGERMVVCVLEEEMYDW